MNSIELVLIDGVYYLKNTSYNAITAQDAENTIKQLEAQLSKITDNKDNFVKILDELKKAERK